MSLVSILSKRYFLPGGSRPLLVMILIAVMGVAVGVAALTTTLSIVSGFQKEYKRSILDFNAHVVLMSSGEMADYDNVIQKIEPFKTRPDQLAQWESLKKWVTPLKMIEMVRIKMANQFTTWMDALGDGEPGPLMKVLFTFDPIMMSERLRTRGIYPKFLVNGITRVIDLSSRGVTGITPFIYREGLVASKGQVKGVVLKGVDPATLMDVSKMKFIFFDGTTDLSAALGDFAGSPSVVIGKALADSLGVNGGNIKILLPREGVSKSRMDEMFQEFRVTGTFESGLYDYDSQFVFMGLPTVQRLFNMNGMVTGLEMRIDDVDKAPMLASALNNNFPYPFNATHWAELNKAIFQAVQLEKIMFALIVGILVVVAAFNIIGVLVLKIILKTKDIAILKAIGARREDVRRVFVRQGMVLGFAGVVTGIVLGVGCALALKIFNFVPIEPEIYLLSNLPITISMPLLLTIAVVSLLICYVTSRAAAGRIVELNVVEGLRKLY